MARPKSTATRTGRKTTITINAEIQNWIDYVAMRDNISQSAVIEHALSESQERGLKDPETRKRFESFLYATGRADTE